MSMKPNFNPSLTLRGGNTEVAAGGPLGWTDPGRRCTIEVTITQRLDSGEVVVISAIKPATLSALLEKTGAVLARDLAAA